MTYFTKEENKRLEEHIKNNAVERKNNMFDYYKNNEIKFYLSKERLLNIGKYINRQLIIHRNVEHDTKWTTEEKMIVELYDFVVELLDDTTNLQKENERLKEIIENLTTMRVCGDRKQIKNTAQYKLEVAQSRIDKAIKYTKEHWVIDDPVKFKNDLLNILNGGDE